MLHNTITSKKTTQTDTLKDECKASKGGMFGIKTESETISESQVSTAIRIVLDAIAKAPTWQTHFEIDVTESTEDERSQIVAYLKRKNCNPELIHDRNSDFAPDYYHVMFAARGLDSSKKQEPVNACIIM